MVCMHTPYNIHTYVHTYIYIAGCTHIHTYTYTHIQTYTDRPHTCAHMYSHTTCKDTDTYKHHETCTYIATCTQTDRYIENKGHLY